MLDCSENICALKDGKYVEAKLVFDRPYVCQVIANPGDDLIKVELARDDETIVGGSPSSFV